MLPIQDKTFFIASNVAVGITCLLSIVGALSIMASFVFFKEHRTVTRLLLFNLSLADFMVALANLVGVCASGRYLNVTHTVHSSYRNNTLCVVQGGMSMYATNSSILWTIAVIGYLYFVLACCQPRRTAKVIVITALFVICWGVPMILLVYFTVKEYFGFEPEFSPGFCTYVISHTNSSTASIERSILGYGMFLYLSFIAIPLLTAAFIIHISWIFKRQTRYYSLSSSFKKAEMKLVFVAVIFIFIRMWGLILNIGTFYLGKQASNKFKESTLSGALVFAAGIGDSAQGFMNGLFFCYLTLPVRHRLYKGCLKLLCYGKYASCACCKNDEYVPMIASNDINTTSTLPARSVIASRPQSSERMSKASRDTDATFHTSRSRGESLTSMISDRSVMLYSQEYPS